MDGVNIKSRTGPEDSVADTRAKTTDEESEIEEKRAGTRLTHIVPLLQVRSLWPKTSRKATTWCGHKKKFCRNWEQILVVPILIFP